MSEAVHQGGVEYLLRVGPAGAPGVSRLVRVRFTEPAYLDGMVTVGLRWEATGVTGGLFPALDADIQISAEEGESVTVTLTGSYRPPLMAASNPGQLRHSLRALDLQLSEEQRHRIDAVGEPHLGEPHVHNLDSDPLYFPGEHYPPAIPAA